ncbi:MAG: MerR family transcriptional regulator [Pseudoxanthomonas sp.]
MLINEIAKIAGMSKDGIRHYEELGLIASTPRTAGSRVYREYDPSVLDTIEKVRQAQQLGFSLKEIGPILKAYAENSPTKEQTIEFLEARLGVIQAKLVALREVEDFICRKLERYRAETAPASVAGDC